MNRTCTVLQQGLTVGDREDRGEPFVHRAAIARFFPSRCSQVNAGSVTILHGPSRWTYGVNTFTQIGLPFPILQGSPRWFLTCQKPPERPPVHPGPSGIIPVHHGGTTVQPPVLPGSPRSMDRGEPGSTGSPVGLGHKACQH